MNNYTDKDMITDALISQKHITGVYNIFANECSSENVRGNMINILNEEHDIQMDIFKDMQKRGWYQVPQADDNKIKKAKDKFSNVKQNM